MLDALQKRACLGAERGQVVVDAVQPQYLCHVAAPLRGVRAPGRARAQSAAKACPPTGPGDMPVAQTGGRRPLERWAAQSCQAFFEPLTDRKVKSPEPALMTMGGTMDFENPVSGSQPPEGG